MKESKLEFFRSQALNLVQAMYGYISPNYRCISLKVKNEIVYIHVILEERDDEEIEEISMDCMTEFEALQMIGKINYKLDIEINNEKNARCTNEEPYSLTIYQRKEESFINEEEYY